MIEFTLFGQVHGGKNQMQTNRYGHHYPNAQFKKWRDQVVSNLLDQRIQQGHMTITEPCKLTVKYFSGDHRRRDVPALMDSLFHCLERAEVVADDSLFKSVGWWDCGYDKKDPRVTVRIEPL